MGVPLTDVDTRRKMRESVGPLAAEVPNHPNGGLGQSEEGVKIELVKTEKAQK